MIFSHRDSRALAGGQFSVELEVDFRCKLSAQLLKHNEGVGVQLSIIRMVFAPRAPKRKWAQKN